MELLISSRGISRTTGNYHDTGLELLMQTLPPSGDETKPVVYARRPFSIGEVLRIAGGLTAALEKGQVSLSDIADTLIASRDEVRRAQMEAIKSGVPRTIQELRASHYAEDWCWDLYHLSTRVTSLQLRSKPEELVEAKSHLRDRLAQKPDFNYPISW